MRFALRWKSFATLALLAAIAWPASSHAYRMSFGTGTPESFTSSAYYVTCDYIDGFDHWNTRTLTWYLNTAGQGAGKEGVIQQALTTWNNAASGVSSDYWLSWGGTTTGGYSVNDAKNTMVWGIDGVCDRSSCHAITAVLRKASSTPAAGLVILEADILFNANSDRSFQWTTDGQYSDACWETAGSSGLKIDTQGIATHELGHALGIGHTEKASLPLSSASPTMGDIGCTTEARTLTTDDTDALECSENRYPYNPLYEGELQTVNCREISGWAWNRNNGAQSSMVEIDYNGIRDKVAQANLFDWALWSAGIGNGSHAFVYPISQANWDGRWDIGARYTGTGQALTGSPQLLICGASLFASLTPAENLSTGGQVYTVGTEFSSNRSGYIRELGFYRASGETGENTLRLYDESGVELASVTPSCSSSGWCWGSIPLTSIPTGALYLVTVNTNTYQAKTGCGIGSGITEDPLTAHSGYWAAGDTYPYNGSCSNFFVDVRFDM